MVMVMVMSRICIYLPIGGRGSHDEILLFLTVIWYFGVMMFFGSKNDY